MGTLVVEGKSDREFAIIDGQQRLATLSIIALAVLDRLKKLAEDNIESEKNSERILELRKRFIGEKDPASLVESSKLFLNENDDGFYQDYLIQLRRPPNPRGLPRSNMLLWECFKFYIHAIDRELEMASSGEALAALLSECISRQLMFILITVDDELNAYTVFETLNARGLELSATDLLKNYLFSRVSSKNDLRHLQRRWRVLVNTVRQERFPEFLRYHLLCEQPKIRTQRLFKTVRERIATPQDVLDLMDALETRAELFVALGDPNHEYWIEKKECRPYIQALRLFRVRQMTPVLFAAWETLSYTNFSKVLKLVNILTFRHTIVTGLNTNELEPVSHVTAKALLQGEASTPAQVFKYLQPIYVDNNRFKQAFSLLEVSTRGPKKKLAKYILCHLESDEAGRNCDYLTDPATVEHILPENPGAEWETSFPPDMWDKTIYLLGNLTLLEATKNREIGNAAYLEKAACYAGSRYAISKQIPDMAPEEWTPESLRERQCRMADRAAHIWRSDFG